MTNASIRIGFITDLSGPYEYVDGHAGAEAIRMAIASIANPRGPSGPTADGRNSIQPFISGAIAHLKSFGW